MAAHRLQMNGRIVAHTIVQVFTLLPTWLFDIVNAAFFVLIIHAITKIADSGTNRFCIALFSFCSIWLFCPGFGQVFLWQDGSINYHWSVLAIIAYLIPFIGYFLCGTEIKSPIWKCLYLLCSVLMGAYTEVGSFGAIFLSILLLVINCFFYKKSPKAFFCLMVVFACLGYISIYLAPAQWFNKSSVLTSTPLYTAIFRTLSGYRSAGTLLVPYAVFLTVGLYSKKIDPKRILLSLCFVMASFAASALAIFAAAFPDRVASSVFFYLLIANVILLNDLVTVENLRLILVCALAILSLLTANALLNGVADITSTYAQIQRNKDIISWHKESGYLDATVPIVQTKTKYSALNGLTYLRTDKADVWPNTSMAQYYGLNSIIAYDEEWVDLPLAFVNEP